MQLEASKIDRRQFLKNASFLTFSLLAGSKLMGCGSPSAAEKIIEELSGREQKILGSIVSSINRLASKSNSSEVRNAFQNQEITMERLIETLCSYSNYGIRIQTVPKINEMFGCLKAIDGAFEKKLQVLSGKVPKKLPKDPKSVFSYEQLKDKYAKLSEDEKKQEHKHLIRIREAFKLTLLTLAGIENPGMSISVAEGQNLLDKINGMY